MVSPAPPSHASVLLGVAAALVVGRLRAEGGALRRLSALFAAQPPRSNSVVLPRPDGHLSVEGLSYFAPGPSKPVLRRKKNPPKFVHESKRAMS